MGSEKYTEERKFSLIDKETYVYLEKEKRNGTKALCFDKFKTDFVIDEDIQSLHIGDKIKIDNTMMEITKIGKNCYPTECELYKKNGTCCRLVKNVAFAK